MIVLILGAPGVGKTTLVRTLLGASTYDTTTRWTVGATYAAAGKYVGEPLDGPDSLPLSNNLLRVTLARRPQNRVCLLDGERYATEAMAPDLRGAAALLLEAPATVLVHRRASRGSAEMPAEWYTRRIARAERDARRYQLLARIDATRTADTIAVAARASLRRDA